ncbi:hypothetical protein CKM354_000747900 [Cercospora kikuchii]|uniref:Uncharacterized protein n=1 Tax=Cercospora kikuchii TaxID=84275 RepID=A0A9P3CK94_9PEZI|nr:uncharacterized protein CKM354_000747900 [Cercospora kikuchii]GIZ44276.1 hypothetical protein CKM354_000747900 [Cercospora kikuchii]
MPAIGLYSTTLYGILVTEESFLKGLRTYMKTQHERKLVTLVAGAKVPTELLERMHEEVYKQARAIVNKKWDTSNSREEKWHKFMGAKVMHAHGAARLHIDGRAVDALTLVPKAPTNIAAPIGPDDGVTGFVLLSTPGHTVQPVDFQRPALVPYPRQPNAPDMCWDAGPESYVVAFQDTKTPGPRVHTDYMLHLTTLQEPPGEDQETDEIRIPRLLRLKHVKEAVQNWDGDLIRGVIEAMELEVVPFDAAKPLEPEIVQYQQMEKMWGHF